jgi:hypothetical protein
MTIGRKDSVGGNIALTVANGSANGGRGTTVSASAAGGSLNQRLDPTGTDALVVREVDGLVYRLLDEIKVPYESVGKRALHQLADLKKILTANYLDGVALPPKPLLKQLADVVEAEIKSLIESGTKSILSAEKALETEPIVDHLTRMFGPREIELRAEPYTTGAGLALRGFFCRANVGDRSKFVIFVNTAHIPAAVAATLGHELGHYIYGSLVGENTPMTYFMEGAFSSHLNQEDELFADSLVALSAYNRDLIRRIGNLSEIVPGSADKLFSRIKDVYGLIGPKWNLDLKRGRMAAAWRVRYLTSMTHFFKLRCALYETAGL